MRYRELVQFEPIESVVQLLMAGEAARARHLVETYVISDRMADQLANVVIPQLQFLRPHDNKGVLIVGNYGTGKSHLLSVIAAVAEFPEMAQVLTNEQVAGAAQEIAGRFKVARIELGSVTGSLRDILLAEIENALAEWETPFAFAPSGQATNNKDAIIEAMAAFQQCYPDHGLLLVVDELLDFLRSREERQLILDLGFLRELGEVAADTRFRFIGGLQETLFDSPRFAFVAAQLRRVRDRFEQVSIARQDIAYVVANRLLHKNDEQLARITEHLRPFTPLYGRLAERIDEFARLFPIHPAFIDTFQDVSVAEKREVLKTFSEAIRGLLDQEVPADQPGLISYDHYWQVLRNNPSMRTYPEVAEVLEKGAVLEGRIEHAYTRPPLRSMALRIVHALGVHRLTTSDITTPLGVTPEELRDDLCLFVQTPEATADFLADTVRTALREISKTVAGQYLSHNDGNDQYYLDVKKDVDFEAKVQERGNAQGNDELNSAFFVALQQVFGLSDSTYTPGHKIWFHELNWPDRNVTRTGYLFFGAPDERSTAQPPRDFYLYILPPYLDRAWHDERRADEVIIGLTALDHEFRPLLRWYAGARAMANDSATHRVEYAGIADTALKKLLRWLQEHAASRHQLTYQGVTEPIGAALATARSTAGQGFEDLIAIAASAKLAPRFAEAYPDYPAFTRLSHPVTEDARKGNAMEAIRAIAGRGRTNLATGMLDALELLGEDGAIRPEGSRYAQKYLELLAAKPEGQVVNWGELLETVASGVYPKDVDIPFRLEAEWSAVVLVAMVYGGQIALTTENGELLDASTVEKAATTAIESLTRFRHYARPKQVPVEVWTRIFDGLGLQAALVRDPAPAKQEQAVRDLLNAVATEQKRVAELHGQLAQGLKLGVTPVFTDQPTFEAEKGAIVGSNVEGRVFSSTTLRAGLRGYKEFLEELAKFNTAGKLRNLKLQQPQVGEALQHRKTVDRVEALLKVVTQLQPAASYLAVAQANLPTGHEWATRAEQARQRLVDEVRKIGLGEVKPASAAALQRDLEDLKKDYIALYSDLHRELVLGPKGDDRKQRLMADPRLKALNTLSGIDLMNRDELDGLKTALANLTPCKEFHERAIAETPTCPFCGFRPGQGTITPAAQKLEYLETRLDGLLTGWRQALRTNLESETARESITQMTPVERTPIEAFLAQQDSEIAVPAGFVKAATDALHGITAVTLTIDDLQAALSAGGLPCTVQELTSRFEAYVKQAMKGHDPRNTRLTLKGAPEPTEVIDLTAFVRQDRAAL